MSRLGFRGKLVAGLAAACSALLLVAFLTYSTFARTQRDRQWVAHTFVVLEKLTDLQSQLGEVESSQRGFLLTGDDSYLIRYERALPAIPECLLALHQLTSDNLAQLRNLDRLEAHVGARLALLQQAIEVRKRQGFPGALALVTTNGGEENTVAIRAQVAAMQREERRLLGIRSAELDLSTSHATTLIFIGEGLGFGFLLLAGAMIREEMNKRRTAELEVRCLNEGLERRVAQRTEELAAQSRELERSNRDLQQFAYVASHDLQEPLRTISSFTQLLAKRYRSQLDDKASEFIDFAVDGCKRMQTLINDLLSFSRVGAQGNTLQPVRCDAVLDRVVNNLRVAIQESGAEIRREPLPIVMADEIQLGQLFQNLIGNAIKFRSQAPPRIHISAQRKGAEWSIRIRDNGIGVSPEHNERIFVIFQRLHTKTQYPGTGIGLAVCKKIAERHGGRIWIEPAPQGGSIFSFTITAGESTDASPTKTKHSMSFEAAPQPIDILLVEDNEADIRLTQEVFTESKIQNNLMIANNGEEAIACLRQQGKYHGCARPDLILLDLNLPIKDGREVLAQIKSDPGFKSIPVVILTTSKAEEDILKTYNLHANCYITKPVDLEQFISVIAYIEDFWLTIVRLPGTRKP